MTDLATRYGRTPERRRRERRTWIGVAVGLVALGLAWLVWSGTLTPGVTVEAQDISSTRIDERSIRIAFEVSVEPGTPVRCAVQAFDDMQSTVGWLELDIDASDQWTTPQSVVVRTADEAVGGLVYRCWLR